MTSLKLYLETFLKHDLSKQDQTKYINYMLRDVHRLSDNINNILDLGRIESGNFQERFIEQDVVLFIEAFYRNNAHLFQNLTIQLATRPNHHLTVLIEPSLFEMLLINLATNARKYNESDQPVLIIDIEKSNKNVVIRFTDNGIGIDSAYRQKIFKKFYQIGDNRIRSSQGSGLGLYLVKNIVRAHHGKIRVESKESKTGSAFVITLPLYGAHSVVGNARKMMGAQQ